MVVTQNAGSRELELLNIASHSGTWSLSSTSRQLEEAPVSPMETCETLLIVCVCGWFLAPHTSSVLPPPTFLAFTRG